MIVYTIAYDTRPVLVLRPLSCSCTVYIISIATDDPGAIRPYADLLLECGEWLASVQTDELACSSMLLHRLAGQGVVRLVCIVIVDNLGFVGFSLSAISQPRYWLARTSLK